MSIGDIFKKGYEATMAAVISGESITKAMTDPSPICPLMFTEIKLDKFLGAGAGGSVYGFKYPGRGTREYAIKVSEDSTPIHYTVRDITFLDLQAEYNLKAEKIIAYNELNLKPTDKVPKAKDIAIPTYMVGCRLARPVRHRLFDGSDGTITFDKGDNLCEESISEFSISLLAGSLYRRGLSINFLDVFYFAVCKKPEANSTEIYKYTFMEQIKSSLRQSISCLFEFENPWLGPNNAYLANPEATTNAMNSIVIQIIHALFVMQTNYQIVHCDLHSDNVFFEFLTPDTEWNGKKLLDADYYEYRVGGKSIYIKGGRECPFIIKIGDWGLSCKYQSPKIANVDTITTGYNQWDGNGPILPNFYTELYDMYLIMNEIYRGNPSNTFIRDIVCWMNMLDPRDHKHIASVSIANRVARPDLKKIRRPIYEKITPRNLLLDAKLMKEFHTVPPAGSNIILIGES